MLVAVVILCASAAFAKDVRIAAGNNAAIGEFPAQIALWGNNGYFCTGSAIASNWIVTAAHCVHDKSKTSFNVVFKMYDIDHLSGHELSFQVEDIVENPNYLSGAGEYPNNIALVKLSGHAPQADLISMATSGSFDGQRCTISGWGFTSAGGSLASILQKYTGPVISNAKCSSLWGAGKIVDTNICFYDGHGSSCNGDSGGPLICGGQLVGVASWGGKACDGSKPSVYSRITEYSDWIATTIRT